MPAQAWITLIVGVLATAGVIGTIRQRTLADARAQAWQRITWCLEHTVSENDREAELGWRLYSTVINSKLITNTERAMFVEIAEFAATQELARITATEDTETGDTEEGQG